MIKVIASLWKIDEKHKILLEFLCEEQEFYAFCVGDANHLSMSVHTDIPRQLEQFMLSKRGEFLTNLFVEETNDTNMFETLSYVQWGKKAVKTYTAMKPFMR